MWMIILGIIVAIVALLIHNMHYPPRFYLPGMLVRIFEPTEKPNSHDWLDIEHADDYRHRLTFRGPHSEYNRPNILLIIADDLGSNDLSGGAGVTTPNIDSIRLNGIDFSQGYAGHATCAPSRAAIMTGRYATRFGFEFTPIPKHMAEALARPTAKELHKPIYHGEHMRQVPFYREMGVSLNETFVSQVLQEVGYTTYMLGKWHLGEGKAYQPHSRGYDFVASFLPGASLYMPWDHENVINAPVGGALDDFLINNLDFAVTDSSGHKFAPNEYMTDFLSNEASRALQRHFQQPNDTPFFMTLAYNAPHNPLQALKSDYYSDEVANISDHTARVYASMIKALDRGVGNVLNTLRSLDQYDNTLIIFTSDNGGAHYLGLKGLNYPFRGWKATLFEGGIRVPFYMQWTKYIQKGIKYDVPVAHVDIFRTICGAANIMISQTHSRLDGLNILANIPILTTQGSKKDKDVRTLKHHSSLYWRSGHYRALRVDNWKIQVSERPEKLWLFDLKNDSTESHNLMQNETLHGLLVYCKYLQVNFVHSSEIEVQLYCS